MDPYYEALMLGILGSFHCLGMCGPIALAVPQTSQQRLGQFIDSLIINTGRITTYTLMGVLPGLLGASINIAGYQDMLSVITGVALLIFVFLPKKWVNTVPLPGFRQIGEFVKRRFHKMINNQSKGSLFGLGLLNGMLPCGLVYMALAISIKPGTIEGGMISMMVFGLATFPMMVSVFFFKNIITGKIKQKVNKLIPVGVTIIAVLFILRGLNLGIPYISPPEKATEIHLEQEAPSCFH